MLAYLVIREGSKWSDVFRLTPGRTVTVGRVSTNQIVIKDDRCSRYHAEIFSSGGSWTLRDLGSRNGTVINGQRIQGDVALAPGDIIWIANCQLAFVDDLTKALEESSVQAALPAEPGEKTVVGTFVSDTSDSDSMGSQQPTRITHRRDRTRLLAPEKGPPSSPRLNRSAAQLCRLAFDLAKQTDVESVSRLALEGLFEGTRVDAGAVLVSSRETADELDVSDLQVLASHSEPPSKYHRISNFLASTVLRESEAVLARNVENDSALGTRDSKGEIESTSVICAPIRSDSRVVGLIHLYSTRADRSLDPDDLEFTLAVADNVALALKNLGRQQELAEHLSQSQSELAQLRKRLGVESEIVGNSSRMQKLHQEIAQAAPNRATVLIRGESGVGKELVARAIHYSSPRKKGPFVCLNCAALSETLLESELFGHEKGAFTGATERKIGKFESADQGTLMLDEIGEMSHAIQAKFLRVLEGHPFERVGGNRAIKVDVRVIAATNRDLEKDVTENKFRRDLYFRLHVVEIVVPPLRKRIEDVIDLAAYFLDRFNNETGKKIRGFTPAAIEQMQSYRWPGNVRELRNVVERAVVLARADRVDVDDLALSSLATASESGEITLPAASYAPSTLAEMERRHILRTLKAESWNKSRTAAVLGIERSTLDRKIRRYELKRGPEV
jgi:Nif-specific regulatory protein